MVQKVLKQVPQVTFPFIGRQTRRIFERQEIPTSVDGCKKRKGRAVVKARVAQIPHNANNCGMRLLARVEISFPVDPVARQAGPPVRRSNRIFTVTRQNESVLAGGGHSKGCMANNAVLVHAKMSQA